MTPSFNLRKRIILSVSPFVHPKVSRPYAPNPRGGHTDFTIEQYTVADRDKKNPPKMTEVFDSFQPNMDELRDIGVPNAHKAPSFVPVEQILNDVLGHWTQCGIGAPNECRPGIWSPETMSVESDAYYDEIQFNLLSTTMYAEFLYTQAKGYEMSKLPSDWANISLKHRIAAAWLGKEESWGRTMTERVRSAEKCPFCTSNVPAEAYVCLACGRTIREIPKRLKKLNPAVEETVEA